MQNLNPNLSAIDVDFLYHLGLTTQDDLKAMFGDVKHVAMMGSDGRATAFAQKLADHYGEDTPKPIGKTDRFVLFKVGPVISVSHGMGQPSHSILLHEITKLMHYAGATDFAFYRLGSCGGVGPEEGDIILSTHGVNASAEATYELKSLGKSVVFETPFDKSLNQKLLATAEASQGRFPIVTGATMSCDDFYIEQNRLDGAFALVTEAEKMDYLKEIHEKGIRNIEMEASGFAAFCHYMGIPAACLCFCIVNRLKGDQVNSSAEQLGGYADRLLDFMIEYLKRN